MACRDFFQQAINILRQTEGFYSLNSPVRTMQEREHTTIALHYFHTSQPSVQNNR